ncbi:hypothetical protein [Bradyrhizobium sp. ERR14]|uniref:hypothetical protein n=1 Tax=Bradyrhizobium sp. ERR14 TaxID=2663837 RepID=UPI0016077AE9|nr:hypothetical protein [Bradyrhizobium sp. ERR14]MBB4397184.1 hypothetical protein [Bradyrhizobium sp. ERR14]
MAKPNLTNQKTLPASAIIVYGIDATGKPKAGRFPEHQAAAAKKAARSLKLAVCNVDRPSLVEIVAKIPVGRVHDQGRALLPYIKRSLYDELAAAVLPARSSAAAATKAPPAKAMEAAKSRSKVFILLGFDENQKPRGARYRTTNEEELIKLSKETALNLYELKSADSISLAGALPAGKLPTTGSASVPEIRQALYSEVVVGISDDAAAVPRDKLGGPLPPQKGSPESWEIIETGHLVIAQESPEYGWAEAIVVDRKDGLLTLRYRDYPKLPKFYRNYRAVALLSRGSK